MDECDAYQSAAALAAAHQTLLKMITGAIFADRDQFI